jgi:hypothetical protein
MEDGQVVAFRIWTADRSGIWDMDDGQFRTTDSFRADSTSTLPYMVKNLPLTIYGEEPCRLLYIVKKLRPGNFPPPSMAVPHGYLIPHMSSELSSHPVELTISDGPYHPPSSQ